jgi:hypothetical protein
VKLQDAETGEDFWLDTSDTGVMKRYKGLIKERRKKLDQLLRASGVDQVEIRADRDYVRQLSHFFRMRARRK